MKGLLRWLPLLMALLMVPACGGNKKAAEKALAAAEAAYAVISEQANNLAPDQAKDIEAELAAAREDLAKGDAKSVLAAAQDVQSKVKTLAEALPGLQTKLEADWKVLADVVPGALAALDKKLEDFGQPPAGMPGRDKFDSAAIKLEQLNTQWGEARSLGGSGKLAQAIALGEQVKYEAVKALTEFQVGS